jgi:threonine dehydrogenase-like Zn-dependent dehydrogenase
VRRTGPFTTGTATVLSQPPSAKIYPGELRDSGVSIQQAYFYDVGDVRVESAERESLGPTELRVEPVVVGMNPGTMTAGLTGDHPRMRESYVPIRHPRGEVETPLLLGQNGVGEVTEVGSAVEAFAVGDLIQADLDYATESVLDVADDDPVVVEESADLEEYAFMTQGGVALNALRRADLTLGDSVVVIGQGPIGLAVTRMASMAGARDVIATDLHESRLGLAREFGATYTTDATGEALIEEVLPVLGEEPPTEGRGESQGGADVVFDCAGVSDAVWAGTKLARHNGTVCVASMHADPLEGVTLGSDFHLRELDLVSAHSWGWDNEWPWTSERNRELFLELAADGELGFARMVTHRVPLAELPAANLFEQLTENPAETLYGIVDVRE